MGAGALLCLFCFVCPACFAQQVSDHALDVLNNEYNSLDKLVQRRAERALQTMENKELSLQRKLQARLHGPDSVRAAGLFAGIKAKYAQMLIQLRSGQQPAGAGIAGALGNPLKEYLPRVDSMQTALRFLGQPGVVLPGQTQQVQAVSSQLLRLQSGLQNANDLQTYFSGREQQLQTQLGNMGVGKQLLGINQSAYYYQAQLTQYKSMLNDPDKMQQVVLSAVRESPYFKTFWQKNSYWSSLFPASANPDTVKAAAGLQTRDQLQQDVQVRLGKSLSAVSSEAAAAGGGGGGSGGVGSYVQSQMQDMQQKLTALKARLASMGGASSGGNVTMPDFQPNSQHSKTFLKRLEYSFSIQNATSTALLPAISTLGLNLGYKLSDKAVVGVGGSYLLGLGYGLDKIRFSSQGIGYRVFGDIQAKGSFWISGGLENTYMQQFQGLQVLRHADVWQKSALVGLTKKYRIGKKSGEIQLLYDLLAARQVPAGEPLKFRMGWSL